MAEVADEGVLSELKSSQTWNTAHSFTVKVAHSAVVNVHQLR